MNGPNKNSSQQGGRQRPQSQGGQGQQQQRRQGAPGGQNQQQGQGQSGQGGQQGGGGGRRRKRRRGGGGGQQQGQGQQQQQGQRQGGGQQQQGQRQGGRNQKSGKGGQRPQRNDAKPMRIQLQPDFKEIPNKHEIRRYGIVFYDTLQAAKADIEQISRQATEFDQLNVIVRNEANMDDPDFNQIEKVKLFAGAAWTLIHERRKEEGWYDSPR
jgi:hypothetical protein